MVLSFSRAVSQLIMRVIKPTFAYKLAQLYSKNPKREPCHIIIKTTTKKKTVNNLTIEVWWWWWWRRRRKAIEMWFHGLPNLYKRATFYLFLSLHSAPEKLTWVGSVPFAKNRLVERVACKGMRCLNTAMLVSPHFKQFRCLHRNVSGFALSILSPPKLLEWPSPEKRPGFYLYYIKLQRQFTFPQRGSFGVIHNGSLRIQKC